jgi:hypothetical protein
MCRSLLTIYGIVDQAVDTPETNCARARTYFYALLIRIAFGRETFGAWQARTAGFFLRGVSAHLAAMHHSSALARLARIIVLV